MSELNSPHGVTIDDLLSANIDTAAEGLVTASATTSPDLFWALKGAGQYFGVVTETTLRLHPLSTLGREDGKSWHWTFIFSADRAELIAKALEGIVDNADRDLARAVIITGLTPSFSASLPC